MTGSFGQMPVPQSKRKSSLDMKKVGRVAMLEGYHVTDERRESGAPP
jgi:hypothetical protein